MNQPHLHRRYLVTRLPACATAGVLLALALAAVPVHAQFSQVLFTDNFLTTGTSTPATSSTDLSSNMGLAGGRQGGSIVNANPAGFGWSVYGTTAFATGNGWDLRAQDGFPATGAVNPYTLRFRDNVANDWSTVTPNIGFNSFIVNNSYEIKAEIVQVHLDPTGVNDRWAGITFGAQPTVRVVNAAANGGVIVFASGAYSIFSNGSLLGNGSVTLPANGVFNVDIQVLNNVGSISINGTPTGTGLDFSGVSPAWIGLGGLAGTNPQVQSSTQFRFDNFAVSTVPEPTVFSLAGLGLALILSRRAGKA